MSADERVWKPSEKSLDISDSDDSESFRDAVLEGSDFSHAFVVADFSRARLRACRFFEANVKTCTFDEADLRGCNFSGAAIDAATFRSARLEGADFSEASVQSHSMTPGEAPTW